ncbi:germin-like protein subfamily 3 member 4 [Lactuca sativa]|uniref:germin-like protein subfamily 3 member 4 n=1 Tax=Lactuca sativa TaxID=4236 RepID=UPI000CC03439|nr:germin-like protein subfamily 3 member 4 [Lactuca sativa]
MSNLNLLFTIAIPLLFHFYISPANSDNLQDMCPTDTSSHRTMFINGFPCKNPSNITTSDFKNLQLSHQGSTDTFLRSSVTLVTASEFPGLNTLGLSTGRTDLEVDGLVMPHTHPRSSEMMFVVKGVVIVGFIDTDSKLFQSVLREGDVFVFPKGLLHYCMNSGFEDAMFYSVFNAQNPGVVDISNAMFGDKASEMMKMAMAKLVSLTKVEDVRVDDGYKNFYDEL